MGRYVKNQLVVEAVRWFKPGDHPAVVTDPEDDSIGYVDTPEGRLRVEPGDWVITGIAGEHYPCKSDVFGRLYRPVE